MASNFFTIINIFGSVALFIYGMKLMSEAIQRAAGDQFRTTLSNLTSNKWLGFLVGLSITGLIQSSSATTVTTISFVHAGLLSVTESVGLILGANVGTTVTGWLVSLFGIKFVLSNYAIPLFTIGVPLLFIKLGKWKYWGEFIMGFGLLFLALGFMRDAVPEINEDSWLFEWLKNFTELGLISRIFFVVIGVIISVIVQSSSVAMAITLTMCAQGWLPMEVAASLILGENIGTTSTGLIASIIGNRNAKWTARVHTAFNIIGVTWMMIILPWFMPLLEACIIYVTGWEDVWGDSIKMTIGLSAFHTAFNLINAMILIHFIPFLLKVSSFGLRDNKVEAESTGTKPFLDNIGGIAEMNTIQIQKEAERFGELIVKMAETFHIVINTSDDKKQNKLIKKIKQYEQLSDNLEIAIKNYITKLNKVEMTTESSKIYQSVFGVCNEMERIADAYYDLAEVIENKNSENTYLLAEQRENINALSNLVIKASKIMVKSLSSQNYAAINKSAATGIESQINTLKEEINSENSKKIGAPDYNLKSAMVYTKLYTILENIGNHVYSVTNVLNPK